MTPEPRPALVSMSTTVGLTFLMTSTICAWTAKASPESLAGAEAVGDVLACDGNDDDGGADAVGVLVPAASGADDCGLAVWKATRAPTLAEPDVPQAVATSAIKTMDTTWATTRCVVRRRDTDTSCTSWAPLSCRWAVSRRLMFRPSTEVNLKVSRHGRRCSKRRVREPGARDRCRACRSQIGRGVAADPRGPSARRRSDVRRLDGTPSHSSLVEAAGLEHEQPSPFFAPGVAREAGFAADRVEHLRRAPAHLRCNLWKQQRAARSPLHDDAVTTGLETGRIGQPHGRLQHGHFDIQLRHFLLGHRRKARVVERRCDRRIADVDPERDVEAHQADAAAQVAALAERYERGSRFKQRRRERRFIEVPPRLEAHGHLDRPARHREQPLLIGQLQLGSPGCLHVGRFAFGRARRQSRMASSGQANRYLQAAASDRRARFLTRIRRAPLPLHTPFVSAAGTSGHRGPFGPGIGLPLGASMGARSRPLSSLPNPATMVPVASTTPSSFSGTGPVTFATLATPEVDGAVRCVACAHRCLIRPGRSGICRVRENRHGRLVTLVYGQVVAANADPIEKKPLFHAYPGSVAFSIATRGCNFHCANCQNWAISQQERDGVEARYFDLPQREVVAAANRRIGRRHHRAPPARSPSSDSWRSGSCTHGSRSKTPRSPDTRGTAASSRSGRHSRPRPGHTRG